MSAKRAAHDVLASAGRQQSGSPGELSFLSGQEVFLLQETGQFAMIKVKGAAHKQKDVLNLMCRACQWTSVTDSVLRNSVCLTALTKGGLELLHRCTPSHGYLALCQ